MADFLNNLLGQKNDVNTFEAGKAFVDALEQGDKKTYEGFIQQGILQHLSPAQQKQAHKLVDINRRFNIPSLVEKKGITARQILRQEEQSGTVFALPGASAPTKPDNRKPPKEDTPDVQTYKFLLSQGHNPLEASRIIKGLGKAEKAEPFAQGGPGIAGERIKAGLEKKPADILFPGIAGPTRPERLIERKTSAQRLAERKESRLAKKVVQDKVLPKDIRTRRRRNQMTDRQLTADLMFEFDVTKDKALELVEIYRTVQGKRPLSAEEKNDPGLLDRLSDAWDVATGAVSVERPGQIQAAPQPLETGVQPGQGAAPQETNPFQTATTDLEVKQIFQQSDKSPQMRQLAKDKLIELGGVP